MMHLLGPGAVQLLHLHRLGLQRGLHVASAAAGPALKLGLHGDFIGFLDDMYIYIYVQMCIYIYVV